MTLMAPPASVNAWIDTALAQSEAGTLPDFIEEFRLAACLGIYDPKSPHCELMREILPVLREHGDIDYWFDFLLDLRQS
jgi:hypothetical protein